jgi:SAM-dependent methyltransferase
MGLAEWDARYTAELAAGSPHESAPSPLLIATASGTQPGRALDLACGTGRNALWLAQRGWQVTAVDGSAAAISMLLSQAVEREITLDARVADLEKGEFVIEPAHYDLIASCYYLQRDLFEPIKQGLAPGGVAIVIALMAKSAYRVNPGELRTFFEGWEILHDRDGPDASGHEVAEIVARKPKANG